VYTGKAGLALLYLKLNKLDLATTLVDESLHIISSSRVTFLTGTPGPLAIKAIICHKQGGQPDIIPILKMAPEVCRPDSNLPDELLYGRAGYLFTLLMLRQELGSNSVPSNIIRQVVDAILRSGQQMSAEVQSRSPLMYAWHDKVYLGAAHGMSGILTVLLQARDVITPAELIELIKPSVEYVLNTAFQNGNFPSSKGNDKDRLVHWCHGAPGVIHLLLIAHQVWGGEEYLSAALKAGNQVWERGLLKKGNGLCHGTAGNGYSLLALYNMTGDKMWLYRAASFADWCCGRLSDQNMTLADRPLSLFEGLAGTAYFIHDMITPAEAKLPALIV